MVYLLKLNNPREAQQYFENKLKFTAGPAELHYAISQGEAPAIIDVRAEEDYNQGHVPDAINLPEDKWTTLQGLSKSNINIIYCYTVVCHLAAKAAAYFASKGFAVMEMEGGFKEWKKYGYPIETKQPDMELKKSA